jgi:hypothetical protein
LLLTAHAYREPLKQFFVLLGVKTHITAMSGSFPPQLYCDFCELTGIDSWDVIRMPSSRPNIAYSVKIHPHQMFKAEAVRYVQDIIRGYNPGEKAMVFCRTKRDADFVAQQLGTEAYHSAQSPEVRQKLFKEWCDGIRSVIVATSILGAGIDQHVLDVVHVDVGWNIIDQFQEDNRAGRNNHLARSTYFVPAGRPPIGPDPAKPFGAELLVPWAMDTEQCRRVAISQFLDGVAVSCLMLKDAEFCDNCLRQISDETCVAPNPPPFTPRTIIPGFDTPDAIGAVQNPVVGIRSPALRYAPSVHCTMTDQNDDKPN